jgi:hypothetical protein
MISQDLVQEKRDIWHLIGDSKGARIARLRAWDIRAGIALIDR